jgi:hypothetical protein
MEENNKKNNPEPTPKPDSGQEVEKGQRSEQLNESALPDFQLTPPPPPPPSNDDSGE